MKNLLILLALVSNNLVAQTTLKFDKRFVECEDNWIAFQMGTDSTYPFGFIYIDSQAGLTLNYEGRFRILQSGQYLAYKLDTTNIKVRLEPNNVLVSLIPENKFEELKIEKVPSWLRFYKTDTASIDRLYRWGYLYNGWNECARGLSYLEKAQKINPDYKGLEVELAFSYNCLGQYDKAIIALQKVLVANPDDAYINKELIYALIKSGQLEKASECCRNAINVCKDESYNGENCYNLLHEYYLKKDKSNFKLWLEETKKWNSKNKRLVDSIQTMEDELKK
jgi:tetratricopeptide (TPR) repeat protein